mmetsp:Transcript_15275/g.33386  ORF Transcript_15275/g.33386 Transcript_15275/m.33386 type:complete len:98 (+) Transcript_15275:156-449(+)
MITPIPKEVFIMKTAEALSEDFSKNGNRHFENGNFFKAHNEYSRSLEIIGEPTEELLYKHAVCLMRMRHYDKALDNIYKLLKLNKFNSPALKMMFQI